MKDFEQQGLRDTAIYNPHLLSKEELIGLFSARKKLLSRFLQDFSRCQPGEPPQHHLLVGLRGMGKTMLLRRLQFAIEEESSLVETWLPLTFPEEQYNVGRLSDLWLNCLDALGDALGRLGQQEVAEQLDGDLAKLLNLEEDRRTRETLGLLVGTAARLERRLVLLVDNIDLVLDRISDQAWALREVLSEEPTILLVGASSRALESSYNYDQPFYDFFQIHELDSLSLEETSNLLRQHAKHWRRKEVLQILESEPDRIRTLYALTGGNPRTLVLLYNILGRGLDSDVRTDLENLLDLCTPFYKARLEALSAQQQRVIHALAIHWHPATAGNLADELRMKVNTVSSQLTRLAREGIVETVSFDLKSKAGFQLAERFFNTWYLMRSTRRARLRLLWLVDFLKMFYSQEEFQIHALQNLSSEDQPYSQGDLLKFAENSCDPACISHNFPIRFALETARLYTSIRDIGLEQSASDLTGSQTGNTDLLSLMTKGSEAFLERAWPQILLFFSEAVSAGQAREGADLLDQQSMSERWQPLRAALETAALGRRSYLKKLAPEVRGPAQEILNQFAIALED